MAGKIHSIETLGLVDGPGIRTVIFFQGCRLRCAYCHNPDTWEMNGGERYQVQELFKKVIRFKPYYGKDGGVTCSGGEPLLQPEFLLEFLKLCKENGIHTAIDTSGIGVKGYDYSEILAYTDLVILDVKHTIPEEFRRLTCGDMDEFIRFKESVIKSGKPVWMRHVEVPGITDGELSRQRVIKISKEFGRLEKLEFLKYHTLGAHKYRELAIPYRIKEIKCNNKIQYEIV